ncbi:Coiled coil domain containing protein, partial [Paragonimus heterotremus]
TVQHIFCVLLVVWCWIGHTIFSPLCTNFCIFKIMGAKTKTKKPNIRRQRYTQVVQQRIATKTPPVQYTRRLKSRKQKKLKQIGSPHQKLGSTGVFNKPPKDDSQHVPASFKEMLLLKESGWKRVRPLWRSGSFSCAVDRDELSFLGVGDTEGMTKPDTINKMPKQGKNESDAHYLERVHREVEDEMTKIQFAKEHKTHLVLDQKLKSSKKVKSIRRLAERKKVKKLRAVDKRRTGYEHLKDVVKFNEVVTAPPIILTKPKKVGSVKAKNIHAIDKLLQT